MAEFIIKYWVEFVFGIIAGGLVAFIKHFYSLYKKEKNANTEKEHTEIINQMKNLIDSEQKHNEEMLIELRNRTEALVNEERERTAQLLTEERDRTEKLLKEERERSIKEEKHLKDNIKETKEQIEILKTGMLSVQGTQFKKDCREALDANHIITLEEYEELASAHDAYKALGGNHNGDSLFDLVKIKYNSGLTQQN